MSTETFLSDSPEVAWAKYVLSRSGSSLQKSEEAEFLDFLLNRKVHARSVYYKRLGGKRILKGKYICHQGEINCRESDFRERLFVGCQALLAIGHDAKAAYITLAAHPGVKSSLGRSKRGQRQTVGRSCALDRRINTVKSLCVKFKSPHKDALLAKWLCIYRGYQMVVLFNRMQLAAQSDKAAQ